MRGKTEEESDAERREGEPSFEVEEEEGMRSSKKQRIEQIEQWIHEVRIGIKEQEEAEDEDWMEAFDDVRGAV